MEGKARIERGAESKEEKRRAGGKETSLKGILNLTEGGIYPIMPYPGATSVAYLRNQSAVQIRRKEVTCLPDLYGFGLVGWSVNWSVNDLRKSTNLEGGSKSMDYYGIPI